MTFRLLVTRLTPAVAAIVLACAVLLLSDLDHRTRSAANRVPLALFQFSTKPTLDDAVAGILDGLRDQGWIDGQKLDVRRFNADNDLPTANAIAKQIETGPFHMVITVSTLTLQAMASANRTGRVTHVFGVVTDPAGAGVEIDRADPLRHPPHLAGIGTFQPVRDLFRLAKQACPGLQTVGTVWCPAEACSVACLEKARSICKELGIRLVEMTVDSSTAVREATQALLTHGVQAIWVGGDNTVELAVAQIIDIARRAKIPVMTHTPEAASSGALLSLGADYREVGRMTGELAGKILNGLNPATVRIEDAAPPLLALNWTVRSDLRERWDLEALAAKADITVDAHGVRRKRGRAPSTGLSKKWRLALIKYAESPSADEGEHGVHKGLEQAGLVEGRDYEISAFSAQGDMALLNSVIESVSSGNPDLVFTLSTPTLQKAAKAITRIPIVFTFVADPKTAGVGKTHTDHLSNVTGAFTLCDYAGMVEIVKELFPGSRRLGTLYAASEANSTFHCQQLSREAKARGLELITLAVNSSTELPDAAAALCSKSVDVVTQIVDNLTDSGFAGIVQATRGRRVPLLGFSTTNAEQGAMVAIARDYEQGGIMAAELAVRVMRGESPATMPFVPVEKSSLVLNVKAAQHLGLVFPQSLRQRASRIIE